MNGDTQSDGPIYRFQVILSRGLDRANQLSVEEHARIAHHAGGPSLDAIRAEIIEYRHAHGIRIY